MIDENDIDKTQEFSIESDAEYYAKNEQMLKQHRDLKSAEGRTPIAPKGSEFPKDAPRYNKAPQMPKDYRKGLATSKDVKVGNPRYPHTPQMPSRAINNGVKSKQKWHRTSDEVRKNGKIQNKKPKLSLSKRLLIGAAILTGGAIAISLGSLAVKNFVSNQRNQALSESQQNLQNVNSNEREINIDYYSNEDNSLYLLNNQINDLLKKYEQNPSSVSRDEVASLLSATYQEGRNVIFPKVAKAYNSYSQENDEFPKEINSKNLVYWHSKGVNGYYISNQTDPVNNPNGQAIAYDNSDLSDFISNQLNIHSLYKTNPNSGAVELEDDVTLDNAINSLTVGITQVNNMSALDVHYEKGLFGNKILKIEQPQKENSDKTNSNTSTINTKSDLGDEER